MTTVPNTTNPTSKTPIAETAIVSKRVRRMFGLSLHGWENWMVGSLIVAAAFALIAGFATWAVVRLQRIELAESKKDFDKFKLDADKKISEATAKALESQLELAKFKAPRALNTEQE